MARQQKERERDFDLSGSSTAFLVDRTVGSRFVCRGARCNNLPVISGWIVSHEAHPCELGIAAAGHACVYSGKLICPECTYMRIVHSNRSNLTNRGI